MNLEKGETVMTHESTILIVDDQRLAQKSLEALLKQEYQLAFAQQRQRGAGAGP
jgi:PleD family two-component response regulator